MVQDFVKFKESQGFDVIVEDVPTIEQNYQGIDRVEKIRNFLKDKTKDYPKSFTLLIGDPYDKNKANSISTGGGIPMRIIYPFYDKPNNFMTYNYPTDFYYCDLDGNWDKNNDEYYGSFNEDDIRPNVHNFVGRIPFSDNSTVKKILVNTVTLQKIPLNYAVLLAHIQSGDTAETSDTAKWGEEARINILEPAGFKVTTLYEKEGDSPSQYTCTAPLNDANFRKYFPGNDIVLTDGHGGTIRAVWHDTNKNGIVDKGELDYPQFFSNATFDFLVKSGYKTKIFYDWGCNTFCFQNPFSSPLPYSDVTAELILSSGLAGVVIGTTESVGFPLDENAFFGTLITSHRPIGEFLYNPVFPRPNAYQTEELILGDPSFSLFDDSLTICADVTPPSVQITSPCDGSITNKTEIAISGTVSDVGSGVKSVEINSNPITFTDNSFNALVKLEEGKNTVIVKVVDKAGNETTITLNIIRDTTVPQILIVSPANNSTVNKETISVSGSVIDENIDTVTVNGKTISLDYNNKFFDAVQLKEGKNEIKINAIDKASNESSQTLIVYYKKPEPTTVIILQIGNSTFTVNGSTRTLDSPPVIKNSRTLLPIRAIIESLGGTIGWDPNEKKVTVTLGSTNLELWIGKNTARVNGVDTPIDSSNSKVVPEIINGRTMLPLRFVTENLGCDVKWDGTTQTITITYPKP
jgi:hypothetical protein